MTEESSVSEEVSAPPALEPAEGMLVPTEAPVSAPVEAPPLEAATAQMAPNEPLPPKNEPFSEQNQPAPQPEPAPAPETVSEPIPAAIPPAAQLHPIREFLTRAREALTIRKRKKLNKILGLLSAKESITNDDVEKLLHVSDATATRYLSTLEKEGSIRQIGKTGGGVVYVKI